MSALFSKPWIWSFVGALVVFIATIAFTTAALSSSLSGCSVRASATLASMALASAGRSMKASGPR